MGEPHVISALRDKRAEISGEILKLEKDIAQRRAKLMHLDATLKLFAPDMVLHTIRPKRPNGRKTSWFGHGERSRLVLSALRTAEGALTAREITGLLMADKNLDPSDLQVWDAIQKTVLAMLAGGNRKGVIQRIEGGLGEAVSWRIAPAITPPGRGTGSAANSRGSQRTADC